MNHRPSPSSRYSEQLLEVMRDLAALKTRTILALIGIVIGTGAVISLLHVSHTARAAALSQFEGLGTDIMMALPQATPEGVPARLPIHTAISALDRVPGVEASAPLNFRSDALHHGRKQAYASIVAAGPEIFSISSASVLIGRRLSQLDGDSPFAVIGHDIASALGLPFRNDVIGTTVFLDGGQSFTVIGILERTPANMILNLDLNNSMVIPSGALSRLTDQDSVDGVAVKATSGSNPATVAADIESALNERIPSGSVRVSSALQLIESITEQTRIYAILLLGIGAVATLVGGVGIMNVMLFSVIERRQEIGLRRALGARQSDIRFAFLLEALLLSIIGSALGIAVGYAGGAGFSLLSGTTFDPSPFAIPLGAVVGLTVGLVFGMIPAIRASRLDPIEALRSE